MTVLRIMEAARLFAGWLLFCGGAFACQAAAPLDCIVGASGRRICLNEPKPASTVVSYSTNSNEPHPATVKKPYREYTGMGQQVKSIPSGDFLPQYFGPRKSQLGQYESKDGVGDASANP